MHRMPTIIQGHQRVAQQMLKPSEASKQLKKMLQELQRSSSSGSPKTLTKSSSVIQGVQQREYIHTSSACPYGGSVAFGEAYEPWSEDMACILQGTCLPGSTRYCRTNSMFKGKLDLSDVQQGVGGYRSFSTLSSSSQIRSFHTTSRPAPPIYDAAQSILSSSQRNFNTTSPPDLQNCRIPPASFKHEAWTEDIACILQGTCLPGSTRYCRTNSMFGHPLLHMADILQDQPRRFYSSSSDASGESATGGGQVSSREKMKRAVRDYGSTVIVFHVCISLISLGSCYLLVSR